MIRSLYLTLIYAAFLVLGAAVPFEASLGYVWVDTFNPQYVAYSILSDLPVSEIMAIVAVGSYLLLDRRSPPRLTLTLVLTVALAAWVTATCFWAEVPVAAWEKWNWAFKTLMFSAFVPFVFRSQVQIEAFLQVYLFSVALHFLPVGIKSMISGGGYGVHLTINSSADSGLDEGSTLATVSLMIIPLALFFSKHSQLLPRTPLIRLGYIALVIFAIAAAIGTYARTALVGLLVVGVFWWLQSRRKLLTGVLFAMMGLAIAGLVSQSWVNRISTTENYSEESSALGRILVWKWTLNYVASHPFGGGFMTYLVDRIEFPGADEQSAPTVVVGKAFHSIYFEALGEHGWIGLGLFLGLIATSFAYLRRVKRRCRGLPHLAWCHDLAGALQVSLTTLAVCGAFIGIAFQPMLYYVVAAATCLQEYVRRVEQTEALVRGRKQERAVAPASAEAVAFDSKGSAFGGVMGRSPLPSFVPQQKGRI